MSYDVKDKVVLVTGANRGIGKVIVETFVEHGASKVYAAVRSLESVDSLVEKYKGVVVPIFLDLSKPESIQEAAETAKDVEVFINNAGVLRSSTPLSDQAIESLRFELDVNLFGLIRVAQAFAPILKANGGGAFVQVNSIVSMKTFSNYGTYSASKAAAYSITQALRELLQEQNTTVLSVHPGPIRTDMGEAAGLTSIAESPKLVADGIIESLKAGEFHVFPDSMAQKI